MDWGTDDDRWLDELFGPMDPQTGDPLPDRPMPPVACRHRLSGRWWRCRQHRSRR